MALRPAPSPQTGTDNSDRDTTMFCCASLGTNASSGNPQA